MNIRVVSVGTVVLVTIVAGIAGLYVTTDKFADKEIISLTPVPVIETDQQKIIVAERMLDETITESVEERTLGPEHVAADTLLNVTEATAVFANGCFWCVEHDLESLRGVINVVSGYTGGTTDTPTYKNHAAGGHREAVLVTYNLQEISYANLVEHIIKHGDPTDTTGSFFDRGPQYAPAIYYSSAEELRVAEEVIRLVNEVGVFDAPLPLPILERTTFYPAEDYHQDYAKNNALKYSYYRNASGRTAYIDRVWGGERTTFSISNTVSHNTPNKQGVTAEHQFTVASWNNFVKPDKVTLRAALGASAYKVTQEDGTERAGTSPLDAHFERGIYVDVVSGEPLFSSRDKYDSGTGWPSFVKPISGTAVTLREDKKLFATRTEVRSPHADSHLGHLFNDGPADRGGLRYCMNGVALRFVAEAEMENAGYRAWLTTL